jgi:hypothetical protein
MQQPTIPAVSVRVRESFERELGSDYPPRVRALIGGGVR